MSIVEGKIYKSHGVLWRVDQNRLENRQWLHSTPLCPNETCRAELTHEHNGYGCFNCDKVYPAPKGHSITHQEAQRKWEGYKTLNWEVHSLDLPPTKVKVEDQDSNYWIKATITERGGKKVAVFYAGEKIGLNQKSKDYTQVFLDLEDEQVRFDKNNKNPMRLLCELVATFPDSVVKVSRKKKR